MSYRLSILSLGNGVLNNLFDIKTDFLIEDMCFIQDFGFLFLFTEHHFIGHADINGNLTLPWMGEINKMGDKEGTYPLFNHPSSICYYPCLKSCYVIEDGGYQIKSIELQSKYCRDTYVNNEYRKYFCHIKDRRNITTSCDIDEHGNLYWVVNELHRCFKKSINDNVTANYIGSGRSGFSISNNLDVCLLSYPSGIRCIKKDIYIADSNNHCIRKIKNGIIDTLWGNPINDNILKYPSKICGIDSIIYVIDNDEIKYYSLGDKNHDVVYASQDIITIDGCNNREIYVLEQL